jgi:acyl transferase domain-containing protein
MLERDIAAFDAPFFSLSEAETRAMDPQERLMLESAYLALENAGVPISNIAGRSDVGVFSAGSKSDYDVRIAQDLATMPRYTATGNTMTMFANKINYFFDLKGPSVTVDTACASSLTALDMAVQNVRSGRCKIAIVGGSFLQSSPISVCEMGAIGTLGKDGKSYSFDSRANGYGRGEGVACVIISTTDEAASANYPIRVAIKATGVNHCGRSQGITMPNGAAQAELIAGVYAAAGLDPVDTPYVEAHGTGTQRGDSIEAQSVSEAFRVSSRTADRPLYVGSVKSNFGHSEAASGVVSVIKCITMLENRMILPNANFEELNPALEALKSQFVVRWNYKSYTSYVVTEMIAL